MIDEQDPEILDAVLDFMYGRPYGVPQGWERLVFHSKMYSAAFYFQLPTLRKTAFGFFESAMSSWRIDERSAIINAARCIYQTPTYTHIAAKTDRGMRLCAQCQSIRVDKYFLGLHDTVSQWFAFNVTEFFGDKKKDMDTELLQLFGDVPALALDIFKHRGSSMFVDVCMKCGVCDGEFGIVKGSSKHNSDIRVRCPFCKVRETQKYVSALEKILMDDRRRRRGEVVEDDGNMSAQSSG